MLTEWCPIDIEGVGIVMDAVVGDDPFTQESQFIRQPETGIPIVFKFKGVQMRMSHHSKSVAFQNRLRCIIVGI